MSRTYIRLYALFLGGVPGPLRFEFHRVVDTLKGAQGKLAGALIDRLLERAVRDQRVNEGAIHCLGGAP